MNTFYISESKNISVMPSWIKSENYMNCGTFAKDITGKTTESILEKISNYFKR